MDQLNPPSLASRSAAFPAAEAKHLADRLDLPYTSKKYGSWRKMMELGLVLLQRPYLRQRLPDQTTRARRDAAWAARHNAAAAAIDGQFTTADARIKLRRRYPVFAG